MNRFIASLFLCCLCGGSLSGGEPMKFSSGNRAVSLLELYTSEGCGSCPPADAWISRLKDDKRLWREVVPVVFHVDYWDRLGWPDRFARKEWTDRQRSYARRWQSRRVYTPCFVRDGKEWRGFFSREPLPAKKRNADGVLTISSKDGKTWSVGYAGKKGVQNLKVHLALLGAGHRTAVKAGENRGRRLSHDFTVHQIASAALNGVGEASLKLPPKQEADGRFAAAAWVSRGADPTPLQATGGWLRP